MAHALCLFQKKKVEARLEELEVELDRAGIELRDGADTLEARLGPALAEVLSSKAADTGAELEEERRGRQQAEARLRAAETRLTDLETELADVSWGRQENGDAGWGLSRLVSFLTRLLCSM